MKTNWATATLGELTVSRPICYGVLKPGPRQTKGVPLIRITDITSDAVDESDLYLITQKLSDEFRRSVLQGGEVLLSIQGTIGRVAICPEHLRGANISRTIALIAPDDRIHRPFLRYWLLSQEDCFPTCGSTRASLNIGAIRELRTPIPSMDEQRRIVAILDEAFEGIAAAKANAGRNRKNCDDAWSQQLTAAFRAEGDCWREIRIGDAGAVITGMTPPKSDAQLYGDAMPFVKPPELQGREVGSAPDGLSAKGVKVARTVPPRSVLVSCIGILGKAAITACRVAFNQQINAVVPDSTQVNPDFLLLQVMSPRFQSALENASSGTTVAIVNKSKFCDLPIVVPPVERQRIIVERLTQVRGSLDHLRDNRNRRIAGLDELKASLLHQAFSGQL